MIELNEKDSKSDRFNLTIEFGKWMNYAKRDIYIHIYSRMYGINYNRAA